MILLFFYGQQGASPPTPIDLTGVVRVVEGYSVRIVEGYEIRVVEQS